MWQVAAFVRSLGRMAAEKVPGDPTSGRRLIESKGGCQRCHSIGGEGGATGPALTEVGSRRSPAFLRKTLLDPNSTLSEGFAMVQAQTRDGRSLSGIRMNESTFSIQFRDMAGAAHSFWKDDLSELRKDTTRSPMPSYRAVFSDSELTDVVAYLASLRGAE
jgi:putative heme-binding domain-containing protein